MLYQNYKEKLSGCMKFLEKVWRFRLFVLIGIVLLLALLFTMLGITGMVYAESCPSATEYGTPIAFQAKALFGKTETQYRRAGEESWTNEQPIVAGDYEVRAVSRSGFGGETHGKIFSYSVLPRRTEVFVAEDRYVYGEELTASAELVYQDTILKSEVVSQTVSEDRCKAEVERVTIVSEDGKDVTSCYDLVFKSALLNLERRHITLHVAGASKIYDGTPLSSADYALTEGTLADGDRLSISFPASLTAAGETKNTPAFRILNADGEDVTSFYDIREEIGTLKVEARRIGILGADREKTYDGQPLELPALRVAEETPLVGGHRLEQIEEIAEAGIYSAEELLRIVDENGQDVTNCYMFDALPDIRIHPRKIAVETSSETWVYDGKPHSAASERDLWLAEDSMPLLAGHTLSVDPACLSAVALTEITDSETEVRYRDNELVCLITDGTGKDVTKNYEIEYRYGQLRIKTKVIVTIYPVSKYYDGKELAFEREDYAIKAPPDEDVSLEGLPTITEAGEITLGELRTSVTVIFSEKDTGKPYQGINVIEWSGSDHTPVLTVYQREITISSISVEIVCNGRPLYGYGHGDRDYYLSKGSLVEGHRLEVTVTGVLYPDEQQASNTIDAFCIYDEEGREVTQNYLVALSEGSLQWIEDPSQ